MKQSIGYQKTCSQISLSPEGHFFYLTKSPYNGIHKILIPKYLFNYFMETKHFVIDHDNEILLFHNIT